MASLGQELKQHREAKKISLEEISQVTHISIRFLQSIERDDYKELPGEIYNRSFIRRLCKAIGFDEAKAIQMYERQVGGSFIPTEAQVNEVTELPASSRISGNALVFGLAVFVLLLVVGGVWYAFPDWWKIFSSSAPKASTQAPKPDPKPEDKPVAPTPSPTNVPPPAPTSGFTLELTATADCWTSVQADEAKAEIGILKTGETKQFQGKDKLIVSIGALQSVTVKLNGQPVKLPTRDGLTAKRVTISADTAKAILDGTAQPDPVSPTRQRRPAPPKPTNPGQ